MIRTLDTSMLNLPHSYRELAPLAAEHGMQAISIPASLLEDAKSATEETAWLNSLGLGWGLLPLPADFYHWRIHDRIVCGDTPQHPHGGGWGAKHLFPSISREF